MKVQLAYPGATPQQIEAHLRASFPRYTVTSRAGMALVGDGAATGVLVKPSGPGQVTLVWAFQQQGYPQQQQQAYPQQGQWPERKQ